MPETAILLIIMKKLKLKEVILAALLGATGISAGLALATVMEVSVAPPIQALPLPVSNVAWSLLLFHLVKQDIRLGYIGSILLGISVIAFPLLVFFGIIGEAPIVVPAHYVGVISDFAFGLALIIGASAALGKSGIKPEKENNE